MADNTVYQLTVGLNVSDEMTNPTDAAAFAMNNLLHAVDGLRNAGIDATFQSAADAANDLNNSLVLDNLQDSLAPIAPAAEEVAAAVDNTSAALVTFKSRASQVSKLAGVLGGRFKQLGKKIQEGQKWLEGFNGDLGNGNGSMVDFEDATHKMAVGLGYAGERAQYMRSEMLQLVGSTQFGVNEVTRLAQGLHKTGTGLDEFGEKSQQNMIALAEVFGVAATDIGRTTKTMEIFGGSLDDVLEDTAAFQNNFDIPGAFQALPQVIDGAMSAFARFGGSVTGGGKQIAKDVMQMAGVYAKAFGKTMAEAVSEAQETYSRFATVTQTSRKVFLGLADDFDPMTKNLMQWNFGLHGSIKLAEDAKSNVVGFVGTMRDKLDSLGGKETFAGGRFLEQLREELPASVTIAIEKLEAYEKMVGAQAEAERRADVNRSKGVKGFQDISNEMLNTTKELRNMWFNTKALVKATLVQTGVMDALKGAFRGAKDVLADFGAGLEELFRSDEFQSKAKAIVPILAKIGKWVLVAGAAFGSFGTAVAGLMAGRAGFKFFGSKLGSIGEGFRRLGEVTGVGSKLQKGLGGVTKLGGAIATPFKAVAGAGGKLTRVLGMIGSQVMETAGKKFPMMDKAISKVGGSFVKMGAKGIPGVGQIIAAVGGVGTALMDMGDVLGDPNATGMAKFESLTRGSIKGVVSFFDNLLLGIPGMVINKFFPDLEASFDKGFENLFGGVRDLDMGDAMGSMWDDAMSWLGSKILDLDQVFIKNMPDWKESMGSMGKTLGGAIGGIVRGLGEVLWYGIRHWSIPGMLYDLFTGAFSDTDKAAAAGLDKAGPGVSAAVLGILDDLGTLAGEALTGIGEGILGAFGSSFKEVGLGFELMWLFAKRGAMELFIGLGEFATDAWEVIKTGGLNLWSGLDMLLIQPLVSAAQWAGGQLSHEFGLAFAEMKAGGLSFISVFGPSLIGLIKDAVGAAATLAKGLDFLGLIDAGEFLAGADSAMASMDKFMKDLPGKTKEATDDLIKLRGQSARGFMDILVENETKSAEALKTRKDSINQDDASRQKGYEQERAAMDAEYEALVAAAQNAGAERKKVKLDAKLASAFARDSKAQYADDLQNKLKSASGFDDLNSQSAKIATKSIQQYADATISGLAKQVRSGALTVEKATKALHDAEAKGISQAMSAAKTAQAAATGKPPRSASDLAGKAQPNALGLSKKMMASFQRGLDRTTGAGKRQQVQVWLRGAGALDKEIAKKSAVKHFESGN